jgi:hypothetical protein
MKPREFSRLVDEMTIVLLDLPELGDHGECFRALIACGFPRPMIERYLTVAQALARQVRREQCTE